MRRLLRALASAGVAAVQLEDQAFPRRCGYLTTEPPVPTHEMLGRLTAAAAADVDLLIVARTDALLTDGLEAAIERAIAYSESGADLVMVNGIRAIADLERIAAELPFPQLYNMSGSDRSPFVALEQAADLGVAVIVYPIHVHRAAALAAERMLTDLVAGRPPEPDAMIRFEQYMDLAGWTEAAGFEQSVNPDVQDATP
jgi:2-methylisocitrate lyase-like PEP mutase family enzyme